MHLINDLPCLFNYAPSRTTVLQHDFNVGDVARIKQHAYSVNVAKRSVMRGEVDYLLEHGPAKPSCRPSTSPCSLVPFLGAQW